MSLPVVLVTAFDAFGGESLNPASLAMQDIQMESLQNRARMITAEIPTTFEGCFDPVRHLIDEHHPAAVILVGQAGGAHGIRVERVAVNIDDARIPDNAEAQPEDAPVAADGPAAYLATLPTREIVKAIEARGIPALLSYSAGTFVCNHLLYSVSHYVACSGGAAPLVGFLHVPYLPEQVVGKAGVVPSMTRSMITEALHTAIAATLEHLEAR